MQQYITRRLLLAVATLIGVSWLIFFIMWIILGDVAIAMLGDGANPDTVAALRQHMGLHDPWYGQYGRGIGHRVSGRMLLEGHHVLYNCADTLCLLASSASACPYSQR